MKAPKDKQVTLSFSLFRLIERALFLGALFYILNLYFGEKSQVNELKYLTEVQNDTIKSFRNEKGEMVSTIKAFQTTRAEDFVTFQSQDSIINILQRNVKYYKKKLKKQGSVTHISSSMVIDTVSVTHTTIENSYPVYTSQFNLNNWVYGKVIAKKDSTKFNLKVKNSYTTIIGREKVGLFKYKPFVEVINHNPYSETKKIRTYQVSLPRANKLGLGLQAGYGLTTI